jgi:hypothetical protein
MFAERLKRKHEKKIKKTTKDYQISLVFHEKK